MTKNGKRIGLLNGNKDCTYAVFIGNERNPGIATSNDESSDLLSVKFIPVWADINVGDEVITSGMDNIFYEGLRVGKVVEDKRFSRDENCNNTTICKTSKKEILLHL